MRIFANIYKVNCISIKLNWVGRNHQIPWIENNNLQDKTPTFMNSIRGIDFSSQPLPYPAMAHTPAKALENTHLKLENSNLL
jgi:hypothetical protein